MYSIKNLDLRVLRYHIEPAINCAHQTFHASGSLVSAQGVPKILNLGLQKKIGYCTNERLLSYPTLKKFRFWRYFSTPDVAGRRTAPSIGVIRLLPAWVNLLSSGGSKWFP